MLLAGYWMARKPQPNVRFLPQEPSPLELMRQRYPRDRRERCQSRGLRWYNNRRRSKACIDATLYIIERELGVRVARETAQIIEYSRAQEIDRREFPSIAIR